MAGEDGVGLRKDGLKRLWSGTVVAGTGAANPGELRSEPTEALTRELTMALAVDLSRCSTPADGGFCTFQPVVDGGAWPWKLDLPQLRQVRAVRRRPAVLALQP